MLRFFGICVLCFMLWGQVPALAGADPAPPVEVARPHPAKPAINQTSVPMYPYSGELWKKFEQFRNDPQLQRLVEEDLQKSLVIRQVIQDEVDRTFNHTTTLLNVLLVVLTAMPILTAVGFWFIRRSVMNQILVEVQSQLQEAVQQQFDKAITAEIKAKTDEFEQEIQTLRDDYAVRLQRLNSDAQREKETLMDELERILPASIPDDISPELLPKLQALTQQLQTLKDNYDRLQFTETDYLDQGKALYLEARYAESVDAFSQAIECNPKNAKALRYKGMGLVKLQQYSAAVTHYDQATCLEPDFYQAWFGKARSYALNGDHDLALESLSTAIALNPERCLEAAKAEPAFENLRQMPEFEQLVAIKS